jgi:hypothetical protein
MQNFKSIQLYFCYAHNTLFVKPRSHVQTQFCINFKSGRQRRLPQAEPGGTLDAGQRSAERPGVVPSQLAAAHHVQQRQQLQHLFVGFWVGTEKLRVPQRHQLLKTGHSAFGHAAHRTHAQHPEFIFSILPCCRDKLYRNLVLKN